MSKKHRRLETFAENVNKRRPEDKRPPAKLTAREKLLIFGTIGGALLLVAGLGIRSSSIRHDRAIEKRVEEWRAQHDLSPSQTDELLEIEMKYHQHEGLLSKRRVPTKAAIDSHRRAVELRIGGSARDH